MNNKKSSNAARIKRHYRVRKNISGTPERPRLNVFRSLSNIYAQVIDDTTGKTLASASSLDKEIKDAVANGGNKAAARELANSLLKKQSMPASKLLFLTEAVIYITAEFSNLPKAPEKAA